MRATEEQIKGLEVFISNNRYVLASSPDSDKAKDVLALTAILEELRESRELLEAAVTIGFQDYFLTRISPETWVRHSDDEASNGVQFNSALDAFAEVKKEENL